MGLNARVAVGDMCLVSVDLSRDVRPYALNTKKMRWVYSVFVGLPAPQAL